MGLGGIEYLWELAHADGGKLTTWDEVGVCLISPFLVLLILFTIINQPPKHPSYHLPSTVSEPLPTVTASTVFLMR